MNTSIKHSINYEIISGEVPAPVQFPFFNRNQYHIITFLDFQWHNACPHADKRQEQTPKALNEDTEALLPAIRKQLLNLANQKQLTSQLTNYS